MGFSHGWMSDTDPEALKLYLRLNHEMQPERKLAAVFEMYDAMDATLTAHEQKLHPGADEREIFLRVATRRLGCELVRKVYGWVADK